MEIIPRMAALLEHIKEISPHAEPILVVTLTAVLGLLIGAISIRGIKLGVAGMLFSGLILGHFGLTLEPELLAFLKEFGLALFVFMVGLKLGPGFFSSLAKDGLKLNILTLFIVLAGAAIVFLFGHLALGWQGGPLAGIFSGSTTNTPSLGAAQQVMANATLSAESSMAYAVAYPFGVLGIIIAMLLVRVIFRINPQDELAALQRELAALQRELAGSTVEPQRITIRVENPNLEGVSINSIPGIGGDGAIISRIRPVGETEVRIAGGDTILHTGDLILVVGTPAQLERAILGIGTRVGDDLRRAPGNLTARRIIVTHKDMIGKTIAATSIRERFGVIVSRVSRQDMVLTAAPTLRLQFGDMLNLVGEQNAIDQAAKALGNSVSQLNETSFATIFTGLTVGILFGLYPWSLPGLDVPMRLGLAGGPLIIAILMGRMGRIGPLVFHLPINANTALRELGIIFFLACVGLGAGGKFFATAFSATGMRWMLLGAATTLLPLLAAGIIGRAWMKLNYLTLTGVLAGSMTDPPALAFATKFTASDHPSLAYANVYPATMLLRILVAQLAVLWLV